MARLYVPSVQDMALVEQAETLVSSFVKTVEEFYASEWQEYKQLVEGVDLRLFRE